MRALRISLTVATLLVLSACSSLLPQQKAETPTVWKSYEEVKANFDLIEPHVTTREQVHKMQIDPYKTSGVTILTYADIMQRFNLTPAFQTENGEQDLVACWRAGKRCTGYALSQKLVKRERVGNFWLDSFRFVRETDVTGWSFSGTILFIDDIVVYVIYGGQPVIKELEVDENPLGPLQGWGDSAGSAAARRVVPY